MRDAANDDDDLRVLAKSDYLCEIDGGLRLSRKYRLFMLQYSWWATWVSIPAPED